MNTKHLLDDLPSNKINWIEVKDFENLCFRLAQDHLIFDQPIPAFVTRNPGILESCLRTPLQRFDGKDLYPSFINKLSILLYLMIKNHPFQNGNKRIAITSLFVVLFLNNLWLSADPYKLAINVSASDRKDKDKVIRKISRFISKNIAKF
jgi:prophage maintenance system killer protein